MNKNDLGQISNLLDEKITPIQKELTRQGKELTKHGKILNSHGKILRSLKNDQSTMLRMLDSEQMQQRKRVRRLEEHLGFARVID